MSNRYNPYSTLTHIGVKGMKWDGDKLKAKAELLKNNPGLTPKGVEWELKKQKILDERRTPEERKAIADKKVEDIAKAELLKNNPGLTPKGVEWELKKQKILDEKKKSKSTSVRDIHPDLITKGKSIVDGFMKKFSGK